jgi:hypothetical protein
VTDFCVHGDEPSNSVTADKFIDYLYKFVNFQGNPLVMWLVCLICRIGKKYVRAN